jgi:hypothetical protein
LLCFLEKPRRQSPLHIPEKETNGFWGRRGGDGGCLLEFGAKKQENNIARYFGVKSNFLYYRKKKPHKLLMISGTSLLRSRYTIIQIGTKFLNKNIWSIMKF